MLSATIILLPIRVAGCFAILAKNAVKHTAKQFGAIVQLPLGAKSTIAIGFTPSALSNRRARNPIFD